MKHLRKYNESVLVGNDFKNVTSSDMEKRMKSMTPERFSAYDVQEILDKGQELGWRGEVREIKVNWSRGHITYFNFVGDKYLLRIKDFISGVTFEGYPDWHSANKLEVKWESGPRYGPLEIYKSEDDEFFGQFELKTLFVCFGMEGLLELMESLNS